MNVGRLRQIIGNLLTNAMKHTPAGGSIRLSVGQHGGEVVLWVDDSGGGMPPELVGRVFETFVQGQASGSTPSGLGLGLSVVRRLVELHGGRVDALSEGLGHGSSFVVRFPAAPGASPEATPAS